MKNKEREAAVLKIMGTLDKAELEKLDGLFTAIKADKAGDKEALIKAISTLQPQEAATFAKILQAAEGRKRKKPTLKNIKAAAGVK